MSEKLKELLNKINEEGVKKALERAESIENEAKHDKDKIIRDARCEAKKIIEDANRAAKKAKDSGDAALKQAARDLVLSLRDELDKIFNKIISLETQKAVSSENIKGILETLIENYIEKNGKESDINVLLKKEDLEKLKNSFIAKFKNRLKDGIEFKSSSNINAGFSISFDKGKSYFDFTDEGLQDALSAYLSPELAKLLK